LNTTSRKGDRDFHQYLSQSYPDTWDIPRKKEVVDAPCISPPASSSRVFFLSLFPTHFGRNHQKRQVRL
ncbi:MAG: hypothetical protein LDL41_24840, partial [Coleofasciculus sp. S288]|nr:hypothetical protein [Coleofasciculus sp. S288]